MTPAPHIVYVQDRFPVLSETFVSGEAAALRELNVDVSVISARTPCTVWGPSSDLRGRGASIRGVFAAHLRWMRRPAPYARYLRTIAQAPWGDKVFMLLAPLIASEAARLRATHIHTHFAFRGSSVARSVAALLALPRSVTTHANDIFVQTRHVARRTKDATVLTISSHNRQFLAGLGVNSQVNYCGVDVDELRAVQELPKTVDVLFVGRLVPKKGLMTLLEAVLLLKTRGIDLRRVLIMGSGPQESAAHDFASSRDLPVEFTGATAPADVHAAMASTKILALPATVAPDGDVDGIPIVLMEAMALGAAVVTTATSGIPELVDGVGWLAPADRANDPSLLAALIEESLADEDLRRTRARAAVERVTEGFTLTGQARGILRVAEESRRGK